LRLEQLILLQKKLDDLALSRVLVRRPWPVHDTLLLLLLLLFSLLQGDLDLKLEMEWQLRQELILRLLIIRHQIGLIIILVGVAIADASITACEGQQASRRRR